MKNYFLTLLSLLVCFTISAQNNIPITNFERLANCQHIDLFDSNARTFGYSFEKKTKESKCIVYEYVKTVQSRTKDFKLFLTYIDYGDKFPVIRFYGSANALRGQIKQWKQELRNKGYRTNRTTCTNDTTNDLVLCFENERYFVSIHDIASQEKTGTAYNLNKIRVYRK